jgi:putative sigma-54 modulation protein
LVQVRVTGRHVEVTKEVRDYLDEKVLKLPRFYDHIHGVEVVLDHESEQFSCEMIVHADRKQTFVAHGTGPDTFALIDKVIEKLERQLTKHKEKNRGHKHDGAV